MIVQETIAGLRQAIAARKAALPAPAEVGFVPTMGYLHDGHASLLRRAKEECAIVVLSIFVNPLQFGPNEDFERYPRDRERDLRIAEAAGADIVFMPAVREMYPVQARTTVSVTGITERLCGASRPGHFDGVATVVSKLFHIVSPDKAYFGMKDAQQVAVIRQMVDDLNMPIAIVPCPTLREPDGLAMSSRNSYLSDSYRQQALVLSRSLELAEKWLTESPYELGQVKARVIAAIQEAPDAVIDYVELLSYPSLLPPEEWAKPEFHDQELLLALAVKFGATRLIDNRLFPLN